MWGPIPEQAPERIGAAQWHRFIEPRKAPKASAPALVVLVVLHQCPLRGFGFRERQATHNAVKDEKLSPWLTITGPNPGTRVPVYLDMYDAATIHKIDDLVHQYMVDSKNFTSAAMPRCNGFPKA